MEAKKERFGSRVVLDWPEQCRKLISQSNGFLKIKLKNNIIY